MSCHSLSCSRLRLQRYREVISASVSREKIFGKIGKELKDEEKGEATWFESGETQQKAGIGLLCATERL